MNEISADSQLAKIRGFERGFKASHLINLGAKMGIFEAIYEAGDGITVPELASKLGLYEPYLKIWCETAYHFEILDCDDGEHFRFQPFLDEILGDKSHFRNYLGSIRISVDIQGDRFINAPAYYRNGKYVDEYTSKRSDAVFEGTKKIFQAYHLIILPQKEHLKEMLEQGARFLDIGCGQGNLIIQLAQEFKNSSFMGVDLVAHGIEKARARIKELGLDERVSFENMRGEALPYEDEFDMVSMTVTFHEILSDVRRQVVERAYRSLKKGGLLLIFDFKYPSSLEDFRNPVYELGVVDQFDETCLGIFHLNEKEQNEMFTKAGFKDIQRMEVEMIKGIELITAVK